MGDDGDDADQQADEGVEDGPIGRLPPGVDRQRVVAGEELPLGGLDLGGVRVAVAGHVVGSDQF